MVIGKHGVRDVRGGRRVPAEAFRSLLVLETVDDRELPRRYGVPMMSSRARPSSFDRTI